MAGEQVKREGMDDLAAILEQSEIAKESQPVIDEQTITGLSRVSEDAQQELAREEPELDVFPLPQRPAVVIDEEDEVEAGVAAAAVDDAAEDEAAAPSAPAPKKRGWLRSLFSGKEDEAAAPPASSAATPSGTRYDDPSSFKSALGEATIAHELSADSDAGIQLDAPVIAEPFIEPPIAAIDPEPVPAPMPQPAPPIPEPELPPVHTGELLDMLSEMDTQPQDEPSAPEPPAASFDEPVVREDDDPFADYPIEFSSRGAAVQPPVPEDDIHKKSRWGFGKRKEQESAPVSRSSAWQSGPDPQEVYSQNYVREEGKSMEPRVERRYEPEVSARSNVKLSTNTVLDVSVVIEGDISIENSIEIYGKIKGNLTCKNNVFLGPDSVVEGGITAKSLRTEGGMIVGDIDCEENVVISNNCQITGNVNADSADIDGTVNGNIIMIGKLFLGPSSAINGDITSSRLVVEPGAAINGRCSTR